MKRTITSTTITMALMLVTLSLANAQLSGTYTIGSGTGYNYSSVAAAASALGSQGVSGPVTFNIADGTYSGQVSLPSAISGASATNTVTFKSNSGKRKRVIITHSSSYTVYMPGTDYVTFKDLTIANTYTSTRYVVYMNSNANYNNFLNCEISGPRNSTTSYSVYCYQSEYNRFEDCSITGNYYGMYFYGWSSTSLHRGNVVENCQVRHHYYYGIYNYYGDAFRLLGNKIDSAQTGIGYAYYQYYNKGPHVVGNEVNTGYYGMMLYYTNYTGTITSADTMRVVNNTIGGTQYYPFYFYYSNYATVFHNSFEAVNSSYYAMYFYCSAQKEIRFANNILVNKGGSYGMYVYFGGTSYWPIQWDHNDYYLNNNTYFAYFNGSTPTSLSALQSLNTNYNQNCVSVDPEFNGNDRRTYSPSLNNIGKKLVGFPYVNKDIDGNARPNSTDKKFDIGPNDYYLSPYDLDVFALVSPLSVNLTTNKVKAQFKNAGSQTISSTKVEVRYSTDSGSTWVSEDMTIASLAPGKVIEYEFSKAWAPTRPGKFRVSIKISQSVSGDPDLLDQKDYDICSGISGTYTIGTGSNADYASFAAAAKDLGCGVAGPLTFKVRPGTYTENLEIRELLGASATNTVTFSSAHRDSVILRSTSGNVINLNGADHVSFENMQIKMDGSSGFTVSLFNQADYNTFKNCLIYNNNTLTSTAAIPVVISGSSSSYSSSGKNAWYNQFIDNTIEGGYFGSVIYGNGTTDPSKGNEFHNNIYKNQYYYGTYFYYTDLMVFHDNVIDNFRNTYNYGMLFYYPSNFDIQRNYSKCADYNYLAYANYYNYNGKQRSIYANNTLISSSTNYALYGYYMTYTNFWHNSIYGSGSYLCYWYYIQNNDIRNNIFYYAGSSYCLYMYNPTFVEWDYNDYVIKGGNLAYITGTVISNVGSLKGWNPNYNQHNYEQDPEWVDTASDLHLTNKFPGLYGVNVGVTDDMDGDKRCAFAPTLGADEFKQSSLPPTANFLVPDTAWLGSPSILLNGNKPGGAVAYRWYVNGVYAGDSIHLEYTPANSGLDTIKLVVENCSGMDSVEKTVYVSPILRKPKVDFSASTLDLYTGDVLALMNLSANGPTQWRWHISPRIAYSSFILAWIPTFYYAKGDSASANPHLIFDLPGLYEVKLVVRNAYGADSVARKAYIKVRQKTLMCDIPWDTDGQYGTLYDNGGEFGSYSPGLNGLNKCTYLISSCTGEIDFDVDVFDVGDGDYLRAYDGVDDGGSPLWDASAYPKGITGNKSGKSVPLSFTAKSGSAYFVFESDGNTATLGRGFAIDWEVNPVTWSAPVAGITAPDTVCVGFPSVFANASTGNYSFVEWDVDNDGQSDASGDELSYTFQAAGTYDIWLRAISLCAPRDSIKKTVVVENARRLAGPDFTASGRVVGAGDTVRLTGTSAYCASGTVWEISPSTFVLTDESDLTDEWIDVIFTRGGYYSIELEKSNPYGKDSIVKTAYIQVLDYCLPSVANLDADVAISRVSFGDIDNSSSTGKTGYANYLHLSTEVERGRSYDLVVERATNSRPMTRKAWIDWNIDGDFDDAGELVASEGAGTSMKFAASVEIPSGATAGKTRMRVSVNYKSLNNVACGPHQFGEFEDYSIVVLDEDRTAPVITLYGSLVDTVEVFDTWTEPGYKAEDLVDGDITGAVSVSNPLKTSVVGTYVIGYSVTDAANNTTTVSRTVVVVDLVAPQISLLGSDTVQVQIFTQYAELGTAQSDNYDASLSVDIRGNVDTANLGMYSIGYCVTDASGNGPVCATRWVQVVDTIYPVIALNGNDVVNVEQCGQYNDEGYTATDNDAFTVAQSGTWNNSTNTRGSYTMTYTATDRAGNTVSVTRTIDVVDTRKPTIELLGNAMDTVERWTTYTDPGVVTDDYCNGPDQVTVATGGNFVNTQSSGLYYISYVAEDASGNQSEEIRRHIWVETPIGMGEDLGNQAFSLYPNPSSGMVNLKISTEWKGQVSIVVYGLNGQLVYRLDGVNLTTAAPKALHMAGLSPGVYRLMVIGNNDVIAKELVIE